MYNNSKLNVLLIPPVNNPFFTRLTDALTNSRCNICTNTNEFWNPTKYYDILHIQFPEFLGNSFVNQHKALLGIRNQLNNFKFAGTKIIWTAHNLNPHEKKYKNLIYPTIVKESHGIIVQSQIGKKLLINKYPFAVKKQIITIPHGNYIGVYPNEITKKQARDKLKIIEEETVFLNFGLQRDYKNVYLVYQAFKKSLKLNNHIRLLIFGQPFTIRRKIFFLYLKYFQKKVTVIPSYIPDNEIQIYFNAADIAIFAYKNIFMSGSVILAESFGLPIIAPNIGCLPDLVPESVGFLYNQNNRTDFASNIINATNSNLSKMGKNAGKLQLQMDWNHIGTITREFYDSILSNRIKVV